MYNKNICKIVSACLPIIFSVLPAAAQTKVTGRVIDKDNHPTPFVPVALINASDSLPLKGTNTNDSGQFIFENLLPGIYFLKVSSVEFKDTIGAVFKLDSNSVYQHPNLIVAMKENVLNEVSISAQKKVFEFTNGNMTVNIENSPLAIGNSVYDILSRMPGVIIDNGSISLQGKQGVSIYIDDRLQKISGMQLMSLLKAMKASSVEKIELIKNPSAKYDAAGSAGIIHIKTKKLKITGFSGNIAFTVSKGYGLQNMPDLSLNYKGKKFTFFSNVNLYDGYLKATSDLYKTINYNSVSATLNSKAIDTDEGKFGIANTGLDWFINKNNTVGVKYQGIFGNVLRIRDGNNFINGSNLGFDNLLYTRSVPNNFYCANYNFNFEHLFDTLGTKVKLSTDIYGPNYDIFNSAYHYRFVDVNSNDVQDPQQYRGYNRLDLAIFSTRLDFEKKLSKTLNLETGIKGSYQNIKSEYTFQKLDNQSGNFVRDSAYCNTFYYREQIGAAYINFQKEIKKINLQMGLRAENTNVHTVSEIRTYKYSLQYFKLFPSVTLNYNRSENHNFSLTYNKRISRPDYNSFNPYYIFNNLFSISTGNPQLLPETSHNFEISHTYKGKLTNSFSYSRIVNPIRGQTLQIDSSLVTIFRSGNLQSSNEIRYAIFLNTEIKKWWSLTLNSGFYYFDFKGTIDGAILNSKGHSFSGYINNQLILPKNFKIEVSAWYVAPWLGGGFTLYQQRGAIQLGIKKSFNNDKLTVGVSVYDLFFTNKIRASVDFRNQHYYLAETYDTRRLNLSLSYNFGKLKVRQRDVKTDEDAKARLKR